MKTIEKSKMKYSHQRERILQLVKSTHLHPTADWIYEKLKPEIPNLSLGTVYRNLSLLKEMGQIRELTFQDDSAHYDGFTADHQHFICNQCRSIYDIQLQSVEKIGDELKSRLNVDILSIRTEFYGVCEKCKMVG